MKILHSFLTRLITGVMLFSVLLSAFACAGETGNNSSVTDPSVTETESEAAETILQPDLPEVKYDGAEFSLLISSNEERGTVKNDFAASEQNGETINDARFMRNLAIEEMYDVDIIDYPVKVGHNGPGLAAIKKSVAAADFAYDAAMMAGYDTCVLAYTDYLINLNSLEYLDLSKPWWDQKANADLTIAGKMFYTTGDISTADNDATYAVLFNKKLVTDYSLSDFYGLVNEGKWTIDQFIAAVTEVHSDLDGNGS